MSKIKRIVKLIKKTVFWPLLAKFWPPQDEIECIIWKVHNFLNNLIPISSMYTKKWFNSSNFRKEKYLWGFPLKIKGGSGG